MDKKRLIVGVSGASGAPLAVALLRQLRGRHPEIDVCLKERRKLVLVARESPLSTLHLRNLHEASQLGAVIFPPMPAWYNHPQTVEDCTRYIANRILGQFDLDENSYQWDGMP